MKSRRSAALSALTLFAITTTFIVVSTTTAQQKPDEKTSPQPDKKELLTVQPAPVPTPPEDSTKKTQQKPSTKIELPQGEVDEKTPVITNTDLITFTVTVTDIYGRFVSGLSKNALNLS